MACIHDRDEQETAVSADGYCPLCLATENERLRECAIAEVWHGDKKVTVYPDTVLRVWGTNMETEMTEHLKTLESVQAAMDWLYTA